MKRIHLILKKTFYRRFLRVSFLFTKLDSPLCNKPYSGFRLFTITKVSANSFVQRVSNRFSDPPAPLRLTQSPLSANPGPLQKVYAMQPIRAA